MCDLILCLITHGGVLCILHALLFKGFPQTIGPSQMTARTTATTILLMAFHAFNAAHRRIDRDDFDFFYIA